MKEKFEREGVDAKNRDIVDKKKKKKKKRQETRETFRVT